METKTALTYYTPRCGWDGTSALGENRRRFLSCLERRVERNAVPTIATY
jgi:hypothetical protein